MLVYTAARVGAVAKLTLKSLKHDGSQYSLRFSEKGGKSREIPVRHDLEAFLLEYVEAAQITEGRLFRTAYLKTKTFTKNAMTGIDICRMMKRRLKGGVARPLLAALIPRHDGDGSLEAERTARGRAVPGRPLRPAYNADLRPAAAEGHAQYRRADLDLTGGRYHPCFARSSIVRGSDFRPRRFPSGIRWRVTAPSYAPGAGRSWGQDRPNRARRDRCSRTS